MEEKIAPLILTQKVNKKYPNAWKQVEDMRKMNGKEVNWDARCYIPIGVGIAIASGGNDNINLSIISEANIIVATATWRLYKQIFSFDKDMEDVLTEQGSEDLIIPIEVLSNLPYPCIYITVNDDEYNGFFVYFESDTNNGELELRFLFINNDYSVMPISLHLIENGTIKDGIDRMLQEVEKNSSKNFVDKDYIDFVTNLITSKLQLVLYICAQNSEITEDERQKYITRKPQKKEYIKDKYREIQKWNCGTQTGNIIRQIKQKKVKSHIIYNNSGVEAHGSPKRPHTRRGHWHHYWKGERGSSHRKLILKWLAPIFIKGYDVNDNVVTTNVFLKENGKV